MIIQNFDHLKFWLYYNIFDFQIKNKLRISFKIKLKIGFLILGI